MKKQSIIIVTITVFIIAACVFIVINNQNRKKEERFQQLIASHMNLIETLISEESFHKGKVENIYISHIKNMDRPKMDFKHACGYYDMQIISLNEYGDSVHCFFDKLITENFAMCEDIHNEIDPFRDSLEVELQRAYSDYELYMLDPEDSFEKEQIIVKYKSLMRKADAVVDGLKFENFTEDYIDRFFDYTNPMSIVKESILESYTYF